MLTKTITALGNSNCIPLDKTLSEMLGVGRGSIVKIKIEDNRMIVEPLTEEQIENKMVETGKRIAKKHSRLMKRLAEDK